VFDLDIQSRILYWKNFREKLSTQPLEQRLWNISNFYWKAPISNQYYSQTDPVDKYPGPWQLVIDNFYDDLARALGMLYTITLCKKDYQTVVLGLYRDKLGSGDYNLVLVDSGKYVLNYDLELRVNNTYLLDDLVLVAMYDSKDLLEQTANEYTNSSY